MTTHAIGVLVKTNIDNSTTMENELPIEIGLLSDLGLDVLSTFSFTDIPENPPNSGGLVSDVGSVQLKFDGYGIMFGEEHLEIPKIEANSVCVS